MATTLIWDADILAYKFAIRCEEEIDWGDGMMTLHSDENQVIEMINEHIIAIEALLDADSSIIVLSDTEANFRKKILPTYKSNRKGIRRPLAWKAARDHMADAYNSYMRPGLEGDDVCGILATSSKIIKGRAIIVSIDKDLGTIPAECFYGCDDKGKPIVKHPTEEEADRFHLFQTLTGDAVDGYAGCPGVGAVAAEAILNDPHTLIEYEHTFSRGARAGETEQRWKTGDPCSQWEAIVCQFDKAGFGEDEALRQARVARILRADDYNFVTKEPVLWTPQ